VYLVNPYQLNERLVIQQGVFLCPSDVCRPFVDNLKNLWTYSGRVPDHKLIKYTIAVDKSERKTILRNLYRMNINHATLFPGLDGFAKSLETLLIFPHILQPHEGFDLGCESFPFGEGDFTIDTAVRHL
jgi:hypothetical protein